MSFKSYRIEPVDDDLFILDHPRPLVFSGAQGLIARFVQGNPVRAERPWTLCPGEIHSLALPDQLVRDRIIVFEDNHGDTPECQWLQQIQGTSSSKTEMMFTFIPLQILKQDNGRIHVRELKPRRTYAEDLCLDGGVSHLKGSWRWHKPHLALGGVVLGQSATAPKPLVSPAS